MAKRCSGLEGDFSELQTAWALHVDTHCSFWPTYQVNYTGRTRTQAKSTWIFAILEANVMENVRTHVPDQHRSTKWRQGYLGCTAVRTGIGVHLAADIAIRWILFAHEAGIFLIYISDCSWYLRNVNEICTHLQLSDTWFGWKWDHTSQKIEQNRTELIWTMK